MPLKKVFVNKKSLITLITKRPMRYDVPLTGFISKLKSLIFKLLMAFSPASLIL